MLYREIMAVCSQIHTKHINTVCGQNVGLLNVKLAVRKETARMCRVNMWTVWEVNNVKVKLLLCFCNVVFPPSRNSVECYIYMLWPYLVRFTHFDMLKVI